MPNTNTDFSQRYPAGFRVLDIGTQHGDPPGFTPINVGTQSGNPPGFRAFNIGTQRGDPTVNIVTPTRPQIGQGAAGEFGGNAIRAVAAPLVRTGGMIESGLDQTLGRLGNAFAGKGFVPTHTGADAAQAASQIAAGADTTLAGGAGTVVGDVAPYLVGAGEGKAISEGAGWLPKLVNLIARHAPDLLKDTAVGTAQTGNPLEGAGIAAGGAAAKGVLEIAGKGGAALAKNAGGQLFPSAEQKIQTAISAVNPELKGKNRVDAYKELVTGKRDVARAGVASKQTLTPSKEVQGIGQRLSDVIVNENPIDNLKALGLDLGRTEAHLDNALAGDPEVAFNANKPALLNKIDSVRDNIPREFAAIRDSKSIYRDVTEYAKQLVNETDDSITGLRNARKAFDQQAQLQYPSAYKEGHIDMKTASGRAIKFVRDTMNEHLYETAPNGSEIQSLIRREADIFKATDYIAPKAAQTHDKTIVEKTLKDYFSHPVVLGLTGLGTAVGAAYAIPKAVQAAAGSGGSN